MEGDAARDRLGRRKAGDANHRQPAVLQLDEQLLLTPRRLRLVLGRILPGEPAVLLQDRDRAGLAAVDEALLRRELDRAGEEEQLDLRPTGVRAGVNSRSEAGGRGAGIRGYSPAVRNYT